MKLVTAAAAVLLAGTLSAFGQAGVSADVLRDLAPTGKLRAAINFGNAVLAQKGPAGEPKGITPDLATELAKRLGVPVEFVPYEAAGKVFEGAKANAWDIAFIAIEPVRAAEIEFTAPYVIIEGTYMVPKDSPLKEIADVDKPGIRIAVGRASAYDLYLTRTIKNATLVRAAIGGGARDDRDVRQRQARGRGRRAPAARGLCQGPPDVRIMAGRVPGDPAGDGHAEKGRLAPRARPICAPSSRTMKASGFVADALKRAGQTASVAPPAQR